MSEIIPFSFDGAEVRLIRRDGEPWWLLADVCRVLEIGNPSDAAKRLDSEEKDALDIIDPMGRPQRATAINESGLYSLVLTSRKDSARRFKRWITSEVLPAIRKTGGYGTPALDLRNPAQLAAAAAQLLDINRDLQAQVGQLAEENQDLTRRVNEDSEAAREFAVLKREVNRVAARMSLPTSTSPPSLVPNHLTATEVLDEMRVPTVGRRTLSSQVTRALTAHTQALGKSPLRDPHWQRPLFHISVIEDWQRKSGNKLIEEHMAGLSAQRQLPLSREGGPS